MKQRLKEWFIQQALEELPEVDEVISIATLNRMDSEGGFLEVGDNLFQEKNLKRLPR